MTKNAGGVDNIGSNLQDYSTALNTSKDQLTDLIRGYEDVNVAGSGSYTLSVTDANPEGRVPVVRLTGLLTGARTVKLPSTGGGRKFTIWNNTTGAFTLTVTTDAGGSTGTPVLQGYVHPLFHDGTNVYPDGAAVSTAGVVAGSGYGPEASIVSAGTLDSTAYGKMHVVTDITPTPADYTVTLPTPAAADVGKFIGFRMSNALTKLVTLDAGATRTIDGQQTRVMWKDEVAILKCIATTGVCWQKVGGKQSRPMVGVMHLNANQSIANATGPVKVTLNTSDTNDGGMTDTTNNRFNIKRPGNYELNAQAWFNSVAVTTGLLDFYKNGAQLFETYDMSPSSSHNLVPKASVVVTLAAGDQLDLRVYQNAGSAQNCIGHATTLYTFMSVVEIPSW